MNKRSALDDSSSTLGHSSSASHDLADYSQAAGLGVLYRSVNVGAGKSPGPPGWSAQIESDKFGVQGLGFQVWNQKWGLRVQVVSLMAQGSGLTIYGFRLRIQGSGLKVCVYG